VDIQAVSRIFRSRRRRHGGWKNHLKTPGQTKIHAETQKIAPLSDAQHSGRKPNPLSGDNFAPRWKYPARRFINQTS